jgi:hypothetical protein
MAGRLHGIYGDAKTMTIQIVASMVGAELEFFGFDESIHLSEGFRNISPLMKLPVLEYGEVVATSVSAAIRFLAKGSELTPEAEEVKA